MKNTVQGTNTVCQFNVNKPPGYNKGYKNVTLPINVNTTLQQQDTAVVLSGKTVHKCIQIQSLGPSGLYAQDTKITESHVSSGGPQEGFDQFQCGETAFARG